MKFSLVTEEYDSLAGHMQSPIEDVSRPLVSNSFDEAVREGRRVFTGLPKYEAGHGRRKYPRRPRIVHELIAFEETVGSKPV